MNVQQSRGNERARELSVGLLAEGAAFRESRLAARRLAQDGAATGADDDCLRVREHRRDLVAACARQHSHRVIILHVYSTMAC